MDWEGLSQLDLKGAEAPSAPEREESGSVGEGAGVAVRVTGIVQVKAVHVKPYT